MDVQTAEPRPIPVWMSIPIILLCLFGGGWIIHWYVMTDPISHESTVLGDSVSQTQWRGPSVGQAAARVAANATRYARDRGNGGWELRTELARADIVFASGKATIRSITYMSYPFVSDDVKNKIRAARSLAADTARTTALNFTSQQVQKLKQLSATITMSISPADKATLTDLFVSYAGASSANRAGMDAKLLQTLDVVANNSILATTQLANDRAKQIDALVTPERWRQNAAMGGGK